jgi:hypothetical protein
VPGNDAGVPPAFTTAKRVRVLDATGGGQSGATALVGPPVLASGRVYLARTTYGSGDQLVRRGLRDTSVRVADIGDGDMYASAVWLGGGRALVTRGGAVSRDVFEGCGQCGIVELLDGLFTDAS